MGRHYYTEGMDPRVSAKAPSTGATLDCGGLRADLGRVGATRRRSCLTIDHDPEHARNDPGGTLRRTSIYPVQLRSWRACRGGLRSRVRRFESYLGHFFEQISEQSLTGLNAMTCGNVQQRLRPHPVRAPGILCQLLGRYQPTSVPLPGPDHRNRVTRTALLREAIGFEITRTRPAGADPESRQVSVEGRGSATGCAPPAPCHPEKDSPRARQRRRRRQLRGSDRSRSWYPAPR